MLVVHVPQGSLVGLTGPILAHQYKKQVRGWCEPGRSPGQFPLQHRLGEKRLWEAGVTSLKERKQGGTLLLSASS